MTGGGQPIDQAGYRMAGSQTPAISTRLAQQDLQRFVNLFDEKNRGVARYGFHPFPFGKGICHGRLQCNRNGGPNGKCR